MMRDVQEIWSVYMSSEYMNQTHVDESWWSCDLGGHVNFSTSVQNTLHCFHKCLTTLKKANITALSPVSCCVFVHIILIMKLFVWHVEASLLNFIFPF